jgi:hypothetical protein
MIDRSDPDTHALLFGIQRSQRYHDRRVAHYELLHRITNVCAVLLSGIVLFELVGATAPADFKLYVKLLAGVGALAAAFDVVIGFSRNADLHRDLKRKFSTLEADMEVGSVATIAEARAKRLIIEADEPSKFYALDLLAHNELCIALGHKWGDNPCRLVRVNWFKRLTANWFHWPAVHS